MRSLRASIALLLAMGAGFVVGRSVNVRAAQSSPAAFPKDVYADTGNRLPALKRDDLDDAGKKLFDTRPAGGDAFGPAALRLYNPPVGEHMAAVNDVLRYKSGLDPRVVQLTILTMAREMDSEYVWTAHEPQGLKAGLTPEVIDVVRYRKPTGGLDEKDATIIELGREVVEKHHVNAALFARARKLFGDRGMVSYASLMGDYAATTVLLNTFDQQIRSADKARLPIP